MDNRRFRLIATTLYFIGCIHIGAAAAIEIETVLVGDPGNVGNTSYGVVNYVYRIGAFEVTNDQYAAFLNAKAASDPLGLLYESGMGAYPEGGIVQEGSNGSYVYTVKQNMGNKPVTPVRYRNAYRFINWLNNGQGDSDTENGVYSVSLGYRATRPRDAKWFLPSENEWLKAAYYDPTMEGDRKFHKYATQSEDAPVVATADAAGNISNPGTNVANYNIGADWNNVDGNVTTVGSAGNTSYYGTYDQTGNVHELMHEYSSSNGTIGPIINARGGSFHSPIDRIDRSYVLDTTEGGANVGFRVGRLVTFDPVDGDFDDSATLEAADIDLLSKELRSPAGGVVFDLDRNGSVNADDRLYWITTLQRSWFGDASLDGQFDSGDLVQVLAAGIYEADVAAGWSTGDFDGSGRFDTSDLVAALADGGYEQGPRPAAAAVPEPGAPWLLLAAAAGILRHRRAGHAVVS
jgi:hypothetical protein